MNLFLVSEYVKKLTKEEVNNFALKKGIVLKENELDIIFNYIKNHYKTIIYGNPRGYLDEIKKSVEPETYNKIENLYSQFKEKINKYYL